MENFAILQIHTHERKNGKENFLGDNGRMEIVCESFQVRKRFSNSFAASEKFQRLQANRSENIFHFLQLFVMEIPQPHFYSFGEGIIHSMAQ